MHCVQTVHVKVRIACWDLHTMSSEHNIQKESNSIRQGQSSLSHIQVVSHIQTSYVTTNQSAKEFKICFYYIETPCASL